ncbi:MAG: DUF962 domain-containing protein [Halobacteriovoraceae bacterium]|nr:DUF962 domain-containing protein [Halobacteriovoraceae bacterium]
MEKKYQTLKEFYPYYLSEHENKTNKTLHFIGTALALIVFSIVAFQGLWNWLPIVFVMGYLFAWIGHFFFEKNKPATFQYPLYSFICDFLMFFDILRGRVKF